MTCCSATGLPALPVCFRWLCEFASDLSSPRQQPRPQAIWRLDTSTVRTRTLRSKDCVTYRQLGSRSSLIPWREVPSSRSPFFEVRDEEQRGCRAGPSRPCPRSRAMARPRRQKVIATALGDAQGINNLCMREQGRTPVRSHMYMYVVACGASLLSSTGFLRASFPDRRFVVVAALPTAPKRRALQASAVLAPPAMTRHRLDR